MKSISKRNLTVLTILAAALGLAVFTTVAPTYARDHDDDDEEHFERGEEREEFEEMMMHIEMFNQALKLVDRITEITGDKSRTGVAAVMGLEEHHEEPAEVVAALEGLLPQVSDPQVQRAIRFKLAEFYGETDQQDKARRQLELLILGKSAAE